MVNGAVALLLGCHSKRHDPDVFGSSSGVPPWTESSSYPWQAQTGARVNDVIAGCTVQSALVPASDVRQLSTAMQVLAQHCSEPRASRVGKGPISALYLSQLSRDLRIAATLGS